MAKAACWTLTDAEARKRGENRIRYPGSPRRKRWILGGGIDPSVPQPTH